MNRSSLHSLILSVYDPSRSGVFFNGDRIVSAAPNIVYRRVSSQLHELHIQATSSSLQSLRVGDVGDLHLRVHAGSDRTVEIPVGKVKVESLYVETLGSEVPVVVVVLKNTQ